VLKLERRIAAYIARCAVLRRGEGVLLMLSGGADSMAMLALVGAADRRLGLDLGLHALHVDYGLRGDDSTRDGEIVARACRAAGIDLDVVRLGGRLRGADFQARARELRYERAWAVAARTGCAAVAAAHNRDDQAETILYRLAKYASPQALAGMRPREEAAPERAALARPLLCLGAAEIREYCAARGIEYGEDVTNAEPVYARNVVRHEVLPRLAALNPRVVETLAASAEVAAAQRDIVGAAVDAAWARVVGEPDGEAAVVLDLAALAREPEALRALCLHRLVAHGRASGALVERREVEALARLVERRDDAGSVTLRGGWEVVRGGGRLRLRRRTPPHACPPVAPLVGHRVPFCGRHYRIDVRQGAVRPVPGGAPVAPREAPAGRGAPLEAFVGLAAPPATVELRHPVRGDRFTPLGMERETTVARFLAAARVPPAARERALVLTLDGRVSWVGYETRSGERRGRVAQPFRVSESTGCTLHVAEEVG
jgi:tRNA(Ile)-lysidine synthase